MSARSTYSRGGARRVGLAALLFLGLASTVGTSLEAVLPAVGRALGGFGKLSLASPFPKVFCRVGDEEPFGYGHVVTLELEGGGAIEVPIDRARYARFVAPYQTRNVYGAVFSFASRLRAETTDAVIAHGFCDGGELLPLVGELTPGAHITAVTVLSSPREGVLGESRERRIVCTGG